MRRITVVLALLALSAAGVSRDAFDRTAAEGAARIVLNAIAGEALTGGAAAKAQLVAAMMGDPGKYTVAAKAREGLKDDFRRWLEQKYAAEAAKVLERLARPGKPEDAFTAEFREKAVVMPSATAEKSLSDVYPGAFEAARIEACRQQAATLQATVRPSEEEVERLSAEELRKVLSDRLAKEQKTPVFEENLAYISEQIAQPMVEEAKRQRDWQVESVRRDRPDGYAPAVIQRALVERLARKVEDRRQKAKDGKWVYGFFPSVTNSVVVERSEKVAMQRAVDGVQELQLSVDASEVGKRFTQEPEKHAKRDASEREISAMLEGRVREAALAAVCAKAPEGERAQFGEFVRARSDKGAYAAAVHRRVGEDLMPQVRRIREEFARRQFSTTYPTVADGTWFPDGGTVDAFCERHDYKAAVRGWREQKELDQLAAAGKGKTFLEEADGLVDAGVQSAFDRANSARNAQLKFVQREGGEMQRRLKAADASLPKLEEVVAELTKAVEGDWTEAREKVLWNGVKERPKNAAEQHRELFPSVRERIVEKAKAMLEQAEKEKEEQKPKTPDQPDSSPSEEELVPVEVPCEIVLDWQRGNITAELLVDGKTRKKMSFDANPERYAEGIRKACSELSEELRKSIRVRKSSTESVKFAVVVRNDFVYCGTAEALLRALVDAVGAEGIAISAGSEALNWRFK